MDPEVAFERGYWTATKRPELTMFSPCQRRVPSLVIPMFSPEDGTVGHQLRPDKPRRDRKGKEIKYETPKGARGLLDVHPRMREEARDGDGDLWITEGIKKADSLTSRNLCTVGLIGVWNWQKDGELLPDWNHIVLNDRGVYVVFDSDVMVKPEVEMALSRLVGALEARGAVVKVIYLPDAQDGSKQGVDDYLVVGGTVEDLYEMARPFEASTFTETRLSRDERLQAQVEAAWMIHESMPTATEKECARRAVYREHLTKAARRGKSVKDGPRYYLAAGEGAIMASLSQPTFSRHTRALVEEGFIRVEKSDDPAHANHYILLTKEVGTVTHNGLKQAHEGKQSSLGKGNEDEVSLKGYYRRESQYPHAYDEVPGLRHSRVIVSWSLDQFDRRVCEVDAHSRLGPRRREILVYLFSNDGEVHKDSLMTRFASDRTQWRDFRRDVLGPMVKDFSIIEIEGDRVRLLDRWRDGVEEARAAGQEQESRERQVVDYELKKVIFRNRDNVQAEQEPPMRGVDDLRKPWPMHPTGCACRKCSERFARKERVVSEHVEDCKCGLCHRLRLNDADGFIGDLERVEDPVAVEEPIHHLSCECDDCLIPEPRYARLWRSPRAVVAA